MHVLLVYIYHKTPRSVPYAKLLLISLVAAYPCCHDEASSFDLECNLMKEEEASPSLMSISLASINLTGFDVEAESSVLNW